MTLAERVRALPRRWPGFESIRGIPILLRLLPSVSRRQSALLGAGVLLAAALPVAAIALTGLLVGSIPDAVRGGLESAAGHRTLDLLVAVGAVVVAQRFVSPMLGAVSMTLGRETDRYLQDRVLAAVGRPGGIAHLEDPDVLAHVRLVKGLGADAQRPGLAVEGLGYVLPSWLQALGSAVVLLIFSWWVGLLWLVVWPIVVFAMQQEYLRVGEVGYGRSDALRRAEYLRDVALGPAAGKEVRVWGMLGWLVAAFERAWYTAMAPVWKVRSPRGNVLFGASGAVLAVNAVSYGLLAWAATRGDLSVAAVAIYTQALAGVNSYTAFDDRNVYLSYAAVTVPKVLALDGRLGGSGGYSGAVSAAPVSVTEPSKPAAAPDLPRTDVRFDGVTFQYPRSERTALRGLDLTIQAGRSLAIVGENGAGKTSLVKLLCGLYAPTDGRLLVDGRDLAELDPAAWRDQVAVLFQDFARYHLPVRDNIGLGAPAYAHDEDRLRLAAQKAGVLDLVESLPHGFDTVLSREYTGGVDLSGGQWQRIALARAMFAVEAGARLLILDEPTAALDVRAEAELYERFLELTEGLTTCLISHRFSTVRRADRIVVLADGGVVEDGSHEELMDLDGRYAEMFTLQASRFLDHQAAPAALPGDGQGTAATGEGMETHA
ncbi:ABC transporter ATP-binding protein [Actinopolymorpha rutila]|uniref:ABC-type multidrug transport system fused ATPase/permease subunit n=1 Tax=Actinopolymorpha rutila TaxID=446787 RepID=A0A852Z9P8_9ACTN|nr:ABC transporter ATP-binding protein [Actinopolymorpha rutila]NYH89634.1 ABC-type multidrug transport system fused ATPase/permease subunit [Actinopolymorpha rutila]